jgi:hypothetical protein
MMIVSARKLLTVMHTRWILFRSFLRNLGDITKMYRNSFAPDADARCLVVCIRDFHHGRYGYLLVSYFSQAGYRIYFHRSLSFLSRLHGYDRAVFQLPGVGISNQRYFKQKRNIDFLGLNADGFIPSGISFGKRFIIDLDYFNQEVPSDTLRIPYHIHPLMQRHPFRPVAGLKRHRILMYGQPDLEWSPDLIRDHFGLLPRSEVFSHLSSGQFDWIRPSDYATLEHFLARPIDEPAACLIDSRTCWIPADQWLRVLSCFDFFIATPGVSMPHSHNMIEAMSVGTIPVTQYGRHLHPPLRDRVDCISFRDLDHLDGILRDLTSMGLGDIDRLRSGVTAYFSEHIEPAYVVSVWQNMAASDIHLLFNAEEASLDLLRRRLRGRSAEPRQDKTRA